MTTFTELRSCFYQPRGLRKREDNWTKNTKEQRSARNERGQNCERSCLWMMLVWSGRLTSTNTRRTKPETIKPIYNFQHQFLLCGRADHQDHPEVHQLARVDPKVLITGDKILMSGLQVHNISLLFQTENCWDSSSIGIHVTVVCQWWKVSSSTTRSISRPS